MKKQILYPVLLLLLLFPGEISASQPAIRIAALDWEPYVGENLLNLGFTSDIIRTAFKRKGYDVVFEFLPWARGLAETEMGNYHGLTCAYYSEDREKRYILSKPFANSILGFCKLKTKPIRFFSLLNLKPYKIGVVRGYVNTQEFDSASYLSKEEAVDDFMNIRKLVRKRVDLILIDKYVMQYIIATKYPIALDKVEFMTPPLEVKPLHIAFSRKINNIQKIVTDFNNALTELYDDRSVDIIIKSHGFIE